MYYYYYNTVIVLVSLFAPPISYLHNKVAEICFVLFSHINSAYFLHATEEAYTATQLNLVKLTKEPSATYQTSACGHKKTQMPTSW